MRFQANLKAISLAPNQRAIIDQFVEDAVKEGARIWVRAAVEKIPVWSGASRATLQALASAVNEHVEIDISSTAPQRIALGRLYSSGGIERIALGNWKFTYETSLRYLIANETTRVAPRTEGLRGSLIEPTPYNFREAGNQAVQAYFDSLQTPLLPLVEKKL